VDGFDAVCPLRRGPGLVVVVVVGPAEGRHEGGHARLVEIGLELLGRGSFHLRGGRSTTR
jgi:hypothetical protein